MRKILKNNNKSKRINGTTKGRNGKFIEIPMDNGARMEIELISSVIL